MRKRDTVLSIPNRRPYVSVARSGGETTYLRIPSHLAAAKLLARLPVDAVQRLASGTVSMLTAAQDIGPPALATLGALIGMAWADPHLELESDPADGEAVYDELHEEGWTLSDITLLGLVVLREVWDGFAVDQEVEERLAFFVPAARRPPGSTSEP